MIMNTMARLDDRLGAAQVVHLVADLDQDGRTGEAVDERHAVEHHARGEHAHQVVLEAGLVAAQVALAPRRQHVGGHRQQLEGHEDGHQIPRRCHDHHAQHRAEDEDVVLALPVVALGDVVGGQQHHHVPGDHEHPVEHQGEVVDHEGAAEHRPVGAVDGQGDERDGRGQQADAGQRGQRALGIAPGEQVDHDHEHDHAGEHDQRRERVVVDLGGLPGGRGQQDGHGSISSPRPRGRCWPRPGWSRPDRSS